MCLYTYTYQRPEAGGGIRHDKKTQVVGPATTRCTDSRTVLYHTILYYTTLYYTTS